MAVIYGIDTEKPYNAKDVRNAIITCFVRAHDEVMKDVDEIAEDLSMEERGKIKKKQVTDLIKKLFEETGGNFDDPNKHSLGLVCEGLKDYAVKFRNQEVIKKHYGEIIMLMKGLEV